MARCHLLCALYTIGLLSQGVNVHNANYSKLYFPTVPHRKAAALGKLNDVTPDARPMITSTAATMKCMPRKLYLLPFEDA